MTRMILVALSFALLSPLPAFAYDGPVQTFDGRRTGEDWGEYWQRQQRENVRTYEDWEAGGERFVEHGSQRK
jgi:hypothetical protein